MTHWIWVNVMGRKCLQKVIVLLLIALMCTSEVAANGMKMETVNDLFQLYNEAAEEDINQLKEEYLRVLEEYNKVANDVSRDEVHNELLAEAEKWKQAEEVRINEEIKKVFKENTELSEKVLENFYGDWESLQLIDIQYKKNLKKIEELIEEKEKYTVSEYRDMDYTLLDELGKEIEALQDVYKDAVEVSILGEVSNVKYPLGADTVMTSGYGDRVDPITGTSIRFHAGIDLRAAVGTPVLSIFNGVVTGTGYGALGGYYVRVNHGNGVTSYYCHLDEITCEVGQRLSQYEQIALSGNTGSRTTGPHLHFGLYIDGNPVNPEILFE